MQTPKTSHLASREEADFATPIEVDEPRDLPRALIEYDSEERKRSLFDTFLRETKSLVKKLGVESRATAFQEGRHLTWGNDLDLMEAPREAGSINKDSCSIEETEKADEYLDQLESSFSTYKDIAESSLKAREKLKNRVECERVETENGVEWDYEPDLEFLHEGEIVSSSLDNLCMREGRAEDLWKDVKSEHSYGKRALERADSAAEEAASVIDEALEGFKQRYPEASYAASEIEEYTEAWEQIGRNNESIDLPGIGNDELGNLASKFLDKAKSTYKNTIRRYEKDIEALRNAVDASGYKEGTEFWQEVEKRSEHIDYLEELVGTQEEFGSGT